MYFQYGKKEIDYLKRKDKKLGEVIETFGHIERPVNPDLFASIVYHIIGQQISTKAHQTVWKRTKDELGEVTPDALIQAGKETIQSFGITFKKAGYILEFCEKVKANDLDLSNLSTQSDEEIIKELTKLNGIGTWTAEMFLIHSLQRPNVFSYGDLAVLRGLKRVYHHENIDKKLFDKYKKRFSPYGSVASIYFWAVAGGTMNERK